MVPSHALQVSVCVKSVMFGPSQTIVDSQLAPSERNFSMLKYCINIHCEKKGSRNSSPWGAFCLSVTQPSLGSYFGATSEGGAVSFP